MSKVQERDYGYIKVHRTTKKHWLWNESRKRTKFEAWLDLLLMANHSTIKEAVGYDLIPIERGQVLTSQEGLAASWKWNRDGVRQFLRMLEKDNMIAVNPTAKYTMITVCNYDTYQSSSPAGRQLADNKPPAGLHQTDTFKNAKNDNNVKNEEEYTGGAGLYTDEQKKDFEKFSKWIQDNAPRVLKMEEPFTIDQVLKLKTIFKPAEIATILQEMHNYKPLTKNNVSAFLTAKNWLTRNKEKKNGATKNAAGKREKPVPDHDPAGGFGFNDRH